LRIIKDRLYRICCKKEMEYYTKKKGRETFVRNQRRWGTKLRPQSENFRVVKM